MRYALLFGCAREQESSELVSERVIARVCVRVLGLLRTWRKLRIVAIDTRRNILRYFDRIEYQLVAVVLSQNGSQLLVVEIIELGARGIARVAYDTVLCRLGLPQLARAEGGRGSESGSERLCWRLRLSQLVRGERLERCWCRRGRLGHGGCWFGRCWFRRCRLGDRRLQCRQWRWSFGHQGGSALASHCTSALQTHEVLLVLAKHLCY